MTFLWSSSLSSSSSFRVPKELREKEDQINVSSILTELEYFELMLLRVMEKQLVSRSSVVRFIFNNDCL
jgi:hypothetical protein